MVNFKIRDILSVEDEIDSIFAVEFVMRCTMGYDDLQLDEIEQDFINDKEKYRRKAKEIVMNGGKINDTN